jgi:hypothetical protein
LLQIQNRALRAPASRPAITASEVWRAVLDRPAELDGAPAGQLGPGAGE